MPYAEVIGDPIAHSKSPTIHTFWAKALGLNIDYRKCHVTPDDLPAYLVRVRDDPNWRGCNVTIPHKVAILDLIDDPGGVRDTIGAANTVLRGENGSLFATNTDAAGFLAPIADLPLAGAPVAVVGSGGAARAVLFALSKAGVGPVQLIARNPLKGAALLAHFKLKGHVTPIESPIGDVRLLVNASSLGMAGQPVYAPDLSQLSENAIVYDAVYTPLETPLLALAAQHGLNRIDGLEMLIGQAALAFELFFGVAPPRGDDAALRALLTE